MDKKDRKSQVGYRNPPKHSQFRPGQSGNPSGRKKGVRSIASELQDILNEQITFASDGAVKTMSKQRALASSLVSAAIAGDLRATAIVMNNLGKEVGTSAQDEQFDDADEFAVVRAHRERKKRA